MIAPMATAYEALAEPHRRQILDLLRTRDRLAGELVDQLGLSQPGVSKHLRVLRDVRLVRGRRHGRHMFYRTNADAIRPLHEWTKTFERFWAHQLNRIKERAEGKSKESDHQQ